MAIGVSEIRWRYWVKTSSVHIVPHIGHEASGPSYTVPRLCSALVAAGHTTKLAVLGPQQEKETFDFVQHFPYGLGPKRLGVSPKMKHWLRHMGHAGNIGIIHNHSLWMATNVYPAKAVRNSACRLVVSPRGSLSEWALEHSKWRKKILWPVFVEPVMRQATAFHVTADSEYIDIRRLGFHQPIAIIPNGIDIPEIEKPKSCRKEMRKLLFLGRIHEKKGIHQLLQAWQRVQARHVNWQLVVAGPDNGGYLQKMKVLAEELGLQRCIFPGPIYGEEKLNAYRQADIFVLPTYSENFGMTVAEALAAGTPAIVTKGAPWAGLATQRAGWWIDIGVEPLVAALEKALATEPETLEEMGRLGREWMIRDFSWDKIAADMGAFYEWLINGGNLPNCVRKD